MPQARKPRNNCRFCSASLNRPEKVFCNNRCQGAYRHEQQVERWLSGEDTGLFPNGVVTNPVKKWLRRKFDDRCARCGWSEINPKTGKVPLVADHIDGNWRNNRPENLRLLCPNCDSLQPTYAGANRGNGRGTARTEYR